MYYNDSGKYKNYQEWLDKSPEWEEIKNFFYKHCGKYRCGVCGAHWKLLLHKRSYAVLDLNVLKKRYFYIVPLIAWYLKRNMVWLCFPCNGQIHFKNGVKTPLEYDSLVKREGEVIRSYRIQQFLNLRPSNLFRDGPKLVMNLARATSSWRLLLLLFLLWMLITEYGNISRWQLVLPH